MRSQDTVNEGGCAYCYTVPDVVLRIVGCCPAAGTWEQGGSFGRGSMTMWP